MQPLHYYVLFFFVALTSEGLQRERDVFIQTVAGSRLRVKTSSLVRRNGIGIKLFFVNPPPPPQKKKVVAINFILSPFFFHFGTSERGLILDIGEDGCFFSPCSVILTPRGEELCRNTDTTVM